MFYRLLLPHIKKFFAYFLHVLYIQIVICFVSIPILVYWGLPISIMSVIGNIIFTPFLCIFIFLSFFIFTTELVCIPNSILCSTLDITSDYWLKALSMGSPKWLIGFAYTNLWYLIVFALVGTASIWLSRTWPVAWRTAALALVLMSEMCMLKLCAQSPQTYILMYHQKPFYLTNTNNQLTLTIPRTGLRKKSFGSWFAHTAHKELYKTFGYTAIHSVILTNPTPNTIKIIEENKELIGYHELVVKKT